MRIMFIGLLLVGIGLFQGCGQREPSKDADPDPKVSDPYLGTSLEGPPAKVKKKRGK